MLTQIARLHPIYPKSTLNQTADVSQCIQQYMLGKHNPEDLKYVFGAESGTHVKMAVGVGGAGFYTRVNGITIPKHVYNAYGN